MEYFYKMTIFHVQHTILLLTGIVQAIHIRDCDPQRQHVEVEEMSGNDPIFCEGFQEDSNIEWRMDVLTGGGFQSIATCTACQTCDTGTFSSLITADCQGTSSSLTFTNAQRQYGGESLQCRATHAWATCVVNIIYAARAATTACSITAHPNRTMSGSCHIARVFSSSGYYACHLIQNTTAVLTTSYTVQPISGDNNYYSGTCSYSAGLPTVTGTYSYVIIVYPGATVVPVSGNVTVAAPTADPVISCSVTPGSYVSENSNVDCYCAVSDLGQPQGRLLVYRGNNLSRDGGYGNSNVTFTVQSINRTDKTVRCELDWITDSAQDRKAEYNFTVAYGPGSVSITADPAVYDRHPTSPRPLTLTCTAIDVFPASVTYTWIGACRSSSNNCTFIPNVTDSGKILTCTVNNIFAQIIKSVYFNLTVYYPPSSSPNITGYTTGDILYDRQSRNMTCLVFEGNPTVTSVTFGCGVKNETSTGASKTISIMADASMDRQRCTCSAVWKNKTTDWYPLTADVYLTVYYGPQSVSLTSLTSSETFDLHPTRPGNITLTCNATEYKPNVTYSWSGPCATYSGSTCSFTPTTNNNVYVITCTANNTAFNSPKSSNRTLFINYPPNEAPNITGYTTGEVIFDGQTRNITCSVTGGNPPVTSVIFHCGNQNLIENGTSKTIRVIADPRVNDQTCTCNAVWKNKTTDWYPLSANVRLTVYYAPNPPILRHDKSLFPFLAGDTTTLNCTLPDADSGNPPAMLRWQGGQGSWAYSPIRMELTLNSNHNGKKVECEAINNFTVYNKTSVTASFLLQVYYISRVDLQLLANNSCANMSDSGCVVAEGQRVHVNCSASSNPPLATVQWQNTGTSVLDLVANRSLAVEHICNASTTVVNNDTRLPLKTSRGLEILTQYTGTLREFVVNGQADNVTVNETTSVRMMCTADGRPSPALSITTDSRSVAHRPEGEAVSVQDVVSVQHDIPRTQCQHSGTYICHTETGATISRTLIVHCGPNLTLSDTKPLETLNYMGFALRFNFSVVASPVPTFEIVYNGPSNSLSQAVTHDKLNVTCWELRASYNLFCIVTIDKMQAEDAGYYSLKMENQLGSHQFNFKIAFNEKQFKDHSSESAIIGGAVAASVVAAAVVIVVVVLIRRRHAGYGKKSQSRQHLTKASTDVSQEYMVDNVAYEDRVKKDVSQEYMVDNVAYEDSVKKGYKARNSRTTDYEEVRVISDKALPIQKPQQVEKSFTRTTENAAEKPSKFSAVDDCKIITKQVKGSSKEHKSANAAHTPERSDEAKKTKSKLKTEKEHEKPRKKKKVTDAVYGNSPLSMKPAEGTEYENCTLNVKSHVSKKIKTGTEELKEPSSRTLNADGLTYATIQFNHKQQEKSKENPPVRDITDYASIDFKERD